VESSSGCSGGPAITPNRTADIRCGRDFAAQAAINGATELEIIRQTGHRSLVTLRRYIREGQLFRAAAAGKLGL